MASFINRDFNFQVQGEEAKKDVPTYKDLDFMRLQPRGFFIRKEVYNAIANALRDDVKILEYAGATDYSLLLAVRYVNNEQEPFDENHNGRVVM